MFKHTQTIRRRIAAELFDCLTILCGWRLKGYGKNIFPITRGSFATVLIIFDIGCQIPKLFHKIRFRFEARLYSCLTLCFTKEIFVNV